MIHSWAVDVEIFPNLFSITFVNLKHYMQVFADCVDDINKPKDKQKPIALTEKLTVAEIKSRLNTVESKEFKISDTDDSQLLDIVAFINGMQSHYDTKVDSNDKVTQEPVRTDLFGFNNLNYDDLMIKAFLMHFNRFTDTKALIKYLYNFSKKIISLQNDKDAFYGDKSIDMVRHYTLPYATVDLQKVFGLHSASVNVGKDGIRNKYPKSLKQTSINLKWHELLDFKLPSIDEEEYKLYWSHIPEYKGMHLDHINQLIKNDFDRYVLPEYIDKMMYYNKNDVFLVCEMARQKPDEIKLRYAITSAFKVNVLCSSRANIADKLTIAFYSKMSGLHKDKFINERTERGKLSFKKIIFPHIQFKTPELQKMLEEMKEVSVYHTTDTAFSKEINFYGTTYKLACGGIHSQDPPRVCISDDKYIYIHHDYTSYYPSIMISYGIAPKHLNKHAFIKMVTYLRDTRVKCKHGGDINVIENVPNSIAAEALKIVINSIYGKLGSDLFFLYDRFAQLQVTINGQLMTMTLVEELELNGIHVISANTDGIVIKCPVDKFDTYQDIAKRWNEFNQMGADFEEYERIISRDVNNYFDIQTNGKIEFKGALDPKQYLKDLKKGYDMPIVAKAVFEYFAHNVPVMETLRNSTDILDFCKTQNIGKQFEVIYDTVSEGKIITIPVQRHVRFYVANRGVIIQKQNIFTKERSNLASGKTVQILNSLDDTSIEFRNIDYKYYYEEAYKIIDPIKLGISATAKADNLKGIKSGKHQLKKYARDYLTLFDNEDFN